MPFILFIYCLLCFISVHSVLNTLSKYTYFYISENITSYLFYLFWKLLKAFSVSIRTNILLHHIKKHYFILSINLNQPKHEKIYFQIYFIYTNDVLRPFERPVYRFWRPNFVAQKTLFKFCFAVAFQQKICWSRDQWFHNASNYFEMA